LVELIYYDLFKRTNQNKPIKIIEVGTGSGVIGLSLIKFMEQQQIKYQLTLTDISEDALEITQENFQTLFPNQPEFGQVKFLQTDLLLDIEQHQLDYLIANLPYVPTARLTQLDKSVKDYEPLLALAGGQAGLQLIERLLVQARRLLNPTSKVFLEIDDTHTKQLLERVVEGYEFELVRDQFGKNRFAIGQLA
jgi:release factor glutamine methyltransferase